MRTVKIIGTGSALPDKKVTNDDLAQLVETSDEWIRERTGIGERRISEGETVADLAANGWKGSAGGRSDHSCNLFCGISAS